MAKDKETSIEGIVKMTNEEWVNVADYPGDRVSKVLCKRNLKNSIWEVISNNYDLPDDIDSIYNVKGRSYKEICENVLRLMPEEDRQIKVRFVENDGSIKQFYASVGDYFLKRSIELEEVELDNVTKVS